MGLHLGWPFFPQTQPSSWPSGPPPSLVQHDPVPAALAAWTLIERGSCGNPRNNCTKVTTLKCCCQTVSTPFPNGDFHRGELGLPAADVILQNKTNFKCKSEMHFRNLEQKDAAEKNIDTFCCRSCTAIRIVSCQNVS